MPIVSDSPTYNGGILLATITTGASAISSVTPNADRFIDIGGEGGGGHIIKNATGTSLPQQPDIQFGEGLDAYNDGTTTKVKSTVVPINWRNDWATATIYAANDGTQNGTRKSSYRCKLSHTSGAANQPGVGVSWATYWTLIA